MSIEPEFQPQYIKELEQLCCEALDDMEYILDCINKDQIPYDGDHFHETLNGLKEIQYVVEEDKKNEQNKINSGS